MKYIAVPDTPEPCTDQILSIIDSGNGSCRRLLQSLEKENTKIEIEAMNAALEHRFFDQSLLRDNSSDWDECIEALIIHEKKFGI